MPDDALSGLWEKIKGLGTSAEGGLASLWDKVKSFEEGVGKRYGESIAELSRPDITAMRGGREIRETGAGAPEGIRGGASGSL